MKAKRLFFSFALCLSGTAILLLMPFTLASKPVPKALSIDAGKTQIIKETTRLSSLTIGEKATITTPSGRSLTLTVDGVETPITAGKYKGNIVLTVTKDILVMPAAGGPPSGAGPGGPSEPPPGGPGPSGPSGPPPGGPGPGGPGGPQYWRAAVYIENGKYIPERSVAAAVADGKVTDTSAKNIKITSVGPLFNGIIATNSDSDISPYSYVITDPVINFTGNGGNDFAGYGFAISSKGYSNVTINNAKINTNGVIRGAIFVGGHSTVHVNNSYIHTTSPPLPEVVTGMMQVPWPLGLTGTCRSTMACEYGTVYYKDSHIVADGWGALSTDGVQKVSLNAENCTIETIGSGYGAYADGNSIDTFSKCKFNVHDMALIMTQGSCVFTNGTVVNSKRFGVMQHSGRGGETLTINKGSVFNTEEAVIIIKSSAPTIIVDNAKLNSKNNVILQVMVSDDPGSGRNGGTVNASFSNMTMKGDIINSMTTLGDLNADFKNAEITGAITMSTWKTQAEIKGIDISAFSPFDAKGAAYSYLIGNGVNTYCNPGNTYGVKVSLDQKSIWTIEKTSYLTGLTLAEGAVLKAPKGYSLVMTVDGIKTTITAGTYAGTIVLSVVS